MDRMGFVAGVATTPQKTGVEKGVRRGDEVAQGRLRAADVGRQRLDLLWYKSKQQKFANDGQVEPEDGVRSKAEDVVRVKAEGIAAAEVGRQRLDLLWYQAKQQKLANDGLVEAEDGVRVKAELVDQCPAVDCAKEIESADVEMCVDAISEVRIESALHPNKLVKAAPIAEPVVWAKPPPPPTVQTVRRNTLAGSGMSDVIAPSLGTAKKIRLEEFRLSAMATDAADDVVEAAPETAEKDADEKKKALNRSRWRKQTAERKGSVQHLKRVVSELQARERVAGGTPPSFGEDMETSIPYESRYSTPTAFGSAFSELPKMATKKVTRRPEMRPENRMEKRPEKRRRGGVATLNEKTVAKVTTARRAINLQTVPEDRAVAKTKQRGFSLWQPLTLFR